MSNTSNDTAVRVAVRVRPSASTHSETRHSITTQSKQIVVQENDQKKVFNFDHVFDEGATQEHVYDEAVQPVFQKFLNGHSGCVIAYGQTATGKTYTLGSGQCDVNDSEKQGIIPRLMRDLFLHIDASIDESEITVSFIEIYNEEVYDLLNGNHERVPLQLRKDDAGVKLVDLLEKVVTNCEDAMTHLKNGIERRKTSQTFWNAASSRSHALFCIGLKRNNFHAKLQIVDLAGSEAAHRICDRTTFREGVKINTSLLTLGHVIEALNRNKTKHVPYRNSMLTRLLQDSLEGSSYTVMIACVCAKSSITDTVQVLRYAERGRGIMKKPVPGSAIKRASVKKPLGTKVTPYSLRTPGWSYKYTPYSSRNNLNRYPTNGRGIPASSPITGDDLNFSKFSTASTIAPARIEPAAFPVSPFVDKLTTRLQAKLFSTPIIKKIAAHVNDTVSERLQANFMELNKTTFMGHAERNYFQDVENDPSHLEPIISADPELPRISQQFTPPHQLMHPKATDTIVEPEHKFAIPAPVLNKMTLRSSKKPPQSRQHETMPWSSRGGKNRFVLRELDSNQGNQFAFVPTPMTCKRMTRMRENFPGEITLSDQSLLDTSFVNRSVVTRSISRSMQRNIDMESPESANCTFDTTRKATKGAALNRTQVSSQRSSGRKKVSREVQHRINTDVLTILNEGSVAKLKTLPGIGPKRAQLIFNWRTINGEFNNVTDLKYIHGLPKNFSWTFAQANLVSYAK